MGVLLEVIVTILSKLVYFTYLPIYGTYPINLPTFIGVKESIDPKYQQDIRETHVRLGGNPIDTSHYFSMKGTLDTSHK